MNGWCFGKRWESRKSNSSFALDLVILSGHSLRSQAEQQCSPLARMAVRTLFLPQKTQCFPIQAIRPFRPWM